MVRDSEVVCVVDPLFPVIVRLEAPTGVLEFAVIVKVEFPGVVPIKLTVDGLKLALAPLGKPLMLSDTLVEPVTP